MAMTVYLRSTLLLPLNYYYRYIYIDGEGQKGQHTVAWMAFIGCVPLRALHCIHSISLRVTSENQNLNMYTNNVYHVVYIRLDYT